MKSEICDTINPKEGGKRGEREQGTDGKQQQDVRFKFIHTTSYIKYK